MLSLQMERKSFRFPKHPCVCWRCLASDMKSGVIIYAEYVAHVMSLSSLGVLSGAMAVLRPQAKVHKAAQVCCVPRRAREGPFLLSRFSCSSYQVITDSPLKYQHGAGTLVMVERQQGSPCNYDTFPQPLLSLHNQLHQGCNNWFSINANAMDLERGRANTQPCCILGLTFEKGNEHSVRFQPDSGVAAAQPRR